MLNAFTLPNGTIYVSAGALARVDDEAQLALLIAHELNHLALDHALESLSDRRAKTIAAKLSGVALGPLAPLTEMGFQAAIAGYSREQEEAADKGGMEWLARAGFASAAAPKLFAAFNEVNDPHAGWALYNDHPSNALREKYCLALVGTPGVAANPDGRNDVARLRRAVERAALESVRLRMTSGEYELAHQDAERAAQRYPESAALQFERGESLLLLGQSLDEANAHMRRALELDPDYRPAQRGLAEVLLAQGDAAGAADRFDAYLRANPGAPDKGVVNALLRKSRERAATETKKEP